MVSLEDSSSAVFQLYPSTILSVRKVFFTRTTTSSYASSLLCYCCCLSTDIDFMNNLNDFFKFLPVLILFTDHPVVPSGCQNSLIIQGNRFFSTSLLKKILYGFVPYRVGGKRSDLVKHSRIKPNPTVKHIITHTHNNAIFLPFAEKSYHIKILCILWKERGFAKFVTVF